MTEKESDFHPFGQQLAYYLHQTQSSQTELAAETDIPNSVISNMKHGKRLTGQNARERVLKIINYFYKRGFITTKQEANKFLASAGMLPLTSVPSDKWCKVLEPQIFEQLDEGIVESQGTVINHHNMVPPQSRKRFRMRSVVISKKVALSLAIALILITTITPSYYYFFTRGWHIRVNRTDDINIVLVNDAIIFVDHSRSRGLARYVNLNKFLSEQDINVITFINLNGLTRAWWDFELRYNNELLWHHRQMGWNEYQLNFARQIRVTQNGQFEETLQPPVFTPLTNPITITMEVQEFALVYINGFPVAGTSDSPSGSFAPFNISPFITQGEENALEIKFWSSSGPYRWLIGIKQGNTIWQCLKSGQTNKEITESEHFIIDGTGNLVYKTQGGTCTHISVQ